METQFYYDQEAKWLHSGGKVYEAPPGGIGKVLFQAIKNHAETDMIAQIEYETGLEESYKAFFAKCIKIALYLKEQGLKPGDIISMSSQNNMVNSAVMIAAMFNGIILASTDPAMSAEDTKYLMELVLPKLIFACEKSIDLINKSSQEIDSKVVTLYEHDDLDNIPAILKRYSEDDIKAFEPNFIADNKETILILFSSGTTGMPKGACITHDMVYHIAMASRNNPLERMRVMLFSTLYWGTSANITCLLFLGGAIKINIRHIEKKDVWKCLSKAKVNGTFLVYAFCVQCTQYITESMPHLKMVFIAGGVLPARDLKEMQKALPETKFVNSYGITEIGSVTFNYGQCVPESAGTIMPNGLILKIVDIDKEQAVDPNEVGEIRVKGGRQLSGYYKRDSADIWDHEGFFKTGDLGYLNDKYELYVIDRIKEMFKCSSSAHLVIPAKIENIMRKHPAVDVAIVIGAPYNTNDNLTKALVILKPGSTVTADELVKYTNDNIEDKRDHLYAGVEFITEADLPYTANNKINRRTLRQRFGNIM